MKKSFTYKKLDIDVMPSDIDTINFTYPWPKNELGIPFSYFAHYAFPTDLLDKKFKELLHAANMAVDHVEVFYRPGTGEEFDAFIHTDGHNVVDGLAKINFIFGGDDNIMRWYLPNVPVGPEHVKVTNAGTKYLVFSPSEVDEIDRVEMKGLYVVNAGIPHSVDMNRGSPTAPRICLSVVPKDLETGQLLGCNDVYDRLMVDVNK